MAPRRLLFALLIISSGWLAGPSAVLGQERVGALYGAVVDGDGAPLSGVTLTLSGLGAPRSQTSDLRGQFRFVQLDPGSYLLVAEIAGFARTELADLGIDVGRSSEVTVSLVPIIDDDIVVTMPTLLDERRIQRGTTITRVELEKIPTARDPWVLLHQTPGVMLDRVNVGGNESGQQSGFVGPGANSFDNNFAVDGVQVTDMSVGISPTYYDFEQFEEAAYTIGGSDVSQIASGVTLNLVTKRGGNDWRGSARLLASGDALQASSGVDPTEFAPGQEQVPTNEIRSIYELGVEAGGPIAADRVWIWGSWATNDINQVVTSGAPDDTLLRNLAVKLNAQLNDRNRFVFWINRGGKTKQGRGAGPGRAPATTWDQEGTTTIWKIEDSFTSSNFFLSAFYSQVIEPFSLIPQGGAGPDAPETLLDVDGVFKNSFQSLVFDFPSSQAQVNGSYFLSTPTMTHDVAFGARYRRWSGSIDTLWPGGRDLVNLAGTNLGFPDGPQDFFFLERSRTSADLGYVSFWLQDTLSLNDWTLNVGLRYDRQNAELQPLSVPANVVRPDLMPAIDDPGGPTPFTWNDVQPRLGFTYAPGSAGHTLLRAGYSRFVQQLDLVTVGTGTPLEFPGPRATFLFIDENGNNTYDAGEFNTLVGASGFDVLDPAGNPSSVDPELRARVTDEFVVGAERMLHSRLAIGVDLTYRRIHRIAESRFLVRPGNGATAPTRVATRDDFVVDGTVSGALPNGQAYSETVYALDPALTWTGGTLTTTGDRRQRYLGLTASMTKRLASNWMARGYFTWSHWDWRLGPEFSRFDDPTDAQGSHDNDGNAVAEHVAAAGGTGAKENVFTNSRWAFNLNGLYHFGSGKTWGFNIAGNLTARGGYPLAYYDRVVGSDGITRDVQVTGAVDSFRNDGVVTLDLSIDKDFDLRGWRLNVVADVFNVFNNGVVLRRELQLNGPRGDYLEEALGPRIVRFGVRLDWR